MDMINLKRNLPIGDTFTDINLVYTTNFIDFSFMATIIIFLIWFLHQNLLKQWSELPKSIIEDGNIN